ncbi:MAG: hypothetical protein ABIN57_10695 [Chitinophagaceae bacterium]
MIQDKKRPTGTLLLAGLAAYAYYKYSKMSDDQKKNIVGDLKEKGKKFYEENVPENIKNLFGSKDNSQPTAAQQGTGHDYQNFNQGSGDQF